MPSKDQIRKRVRRDKSSEESEVSSKKPRLDKEEKKQQQEEVVEQKQSAVDITQRWLTENLDTENVATIVMVTMVSESCFLSTYGNISLMRG